MRPGGRGWVEVTGRAEEEGPGWSGLFTWLAGCVVVYLGLFGTGSLLLGRPVRGVVLVVIALALTVWIVRRAEPEPLE